MKRFIPSAEYGSGSLVGYITCSYADLVKTFGEPNGGTDGYKVSTEWIVRDTELGHTLCIYEYKETSLYNSSNPTVEEFRALPSYQWHIGGGHRNPDFGALAQFIEVEAGCKIVPVFRSGIR